MASTDEQAFITKKDLEATKQELLAKLATKEEIKKLATKEEIKKLATKEELKKLATKKELQSTNRAVDILAKEVSIMGHRLTNVENRLSNVEDNTEKILQIVDGIAKKFNDYETEKVATEYTLKRHERRLDEHEGRIEALERN